MKLRIMTRHLLKNPKVKVIDKSSETLKTKEQPSAQFENSSRSKLTVVSVNVTGVGFNYKGCYQRWAYFRQYLKLMGFKCHHKQPQPWLLLKLVKNGNETFAYLLLHFKKKLNKKLKVSFKVGK